MNRTILALSLVFICAVCFAGAVAAPETPAILVNDSGGDTRTLPLPVSVSGDVSITEGGMPTPTVTNATLVAATSTSITAVASRSYIVIQNLDASDSVYVYPGATATISQGLEILPSSSIARPWGSAVPVAVISSAAARLAIEQGVLP